MPALVITIGPVGPDKKTKGKKDMAGMMKDLMMPPPAGKKPKKTKEEMEEDDLDALFGPATEEDDAAMAEEEGVMDADEELQEALADFSDAELEAEVARRKKAGEDDSAEGEELDEEEYV